MRAAVVCSGAISLVVVTAAWVHTMRTSERAVAQLRGDVAKLQRRIETASDTRMSASATVDLISRLAASSAPSAPAPPGQLINASPEAAAAPLATPEELTRASEEQQQRLALRFDEALSSDGYDRTWGAPMVDTIHSVFEKLHLGRMAKVDCASRLCRLTIEHGSQEQQQSLAQQMSAVPPFDSGAFYLYERGSKPLRTTVYLAREGTELLSVVKDLPSD